MCILLTQRKARTASVLFALVLWAILGPSVASEGAPPTLNPKFVITGTKVIALFDASGKLLGQFIPAQDEKAWWTPFLAPDGHVLLLFDGAKTLHRFELP